MISNIYRSSFISLFLILSGVILVNSCKEVGPDINLTNPGIVLMDTTYITTPETPDNKVVLLEEFTGLTCPNCPAGQDASQDILKNHPERVVVIAIVNYFADPHPDAKEDYQIPEGAQLDNFLGSVSSWPAAAIDRKLFNGEQDIILSRAKWSSYVDDELQLTSPVNITLSKTYDATSRKLVVHVEVKYTSLVQEQQMLSISLTEDSIIDVQDSLFTTVQNYVHHHILRAMLTPYNGISLTSPTGTNEAGRVYIKEFEKVLDNNWNDHKIEIVAFVHRPVPYKEIIQVASLP